MDSKWRGSAKAMRSGVVGWRLMRPPLPETAALPALQD